MEFYTWKYFVDVRLKNKLTKEVLDNKLITDFLDKELVKDAYKRNDMSNIRESLFNRIDFFVEYPIEYDEIDETRDIRMSALALFRTSTSKLKILKWIIDNKFTPVNFRTEWIYYPREECQLDDHAKDIYIYKFFENDMTGNHYQFEPNLKVFNLSDGLVAYYKSQGAL